MANATAIPKCLFYKGHQVFNTDDIKKETNYNSFGNINILNFVKYGKINKNF